MRVYLDNCCFNRPYDDQSQMSIHLESEAKLLIQSEIKSGKHELVWSSILDYENAQNPYDIRRDAIAGWRNLALEIQNANEQVVADAQTIMQNGVANKDALHIASARTARSDVFLTVDRKLLKIKVDGLAIMNPIDFLRYEEEQ